MLGRSPPVTVESFPAFAEASHALGPSATCAYRLTFPANIQVLVSRWEVHAKSRPIRIVVLPITSCLLADDPVPIPVPHVPVRGMRSGDRRDPVPPRLLARDPAVAVVIVAVEYVVPTSAPSGISF